MDKRSAVRIEVNGQVQGKMILVESLKIIDISLTGIRFKSMRRVDMNVTHRIRIERNDISITLKGPVVRSTFTGLQQLAGKSLPVYEVAMHFENVSDHDRILLEKLITILGNE